MFVDLSQPQYVTGFPDQLSDEEIRALPGWYYSVEMRPGVFTTGQDFPSAGLTRAAISRIGLEGQRCIDIGTMEGLIAVLLCRQGAKRVVAYDRPVYCREKLRAARIAYNVAFDLIDDIRLSELRPALQKLGEAPFDVVVFSGVLYHMLNPLGGLASARSLVRDGGLMVLETSAVMSNQAVFAGNLRDRFGGHAYLLPSLPALDYFVRLMRMSVVDCEFLINSREPSPDGMVSCRVCLVARAEREPQLAPDDPILRLRTWTEVDLAEYIDWPWLQSDAAPVPYSGVDQTRYGNGSLDVLLTVLGNRPRVVTKRDVTLHLSDQR